MGLPKGSTLVSAVELILPMMVLPGLVAEDTLLKYKALLGFGFEFVWMVRVGGRTTEI